MELNTRLSQILEEAIKIFAHYGYKKTSMEDVAGKLGMTKGSLYFYCENKQDLYEKAVSHALMKWQRRVREALEGEKDAVSKFNVLAIQSYEYLREDADLRAVIMNDPAIQAVSPAEDRFPSIGQAAYTMVKDILRQGVDEGTFRPVDIEPVAGFLYSVYCMFIIKTYVKSEGQSAGEMYRAGIEMILKGLLKDGHDG